MGILRDRMIEEMKLRNFSPATQESYVYAVSRLAKYHHKSPDQLSKEDIRAFLVHLTVERKLSPNGLTGYCSGLRFFYNYTLRWDENKLFIPPRKKLSLLAEVFSPGEVMRLIGAARGLKQRVLLMTALDPVLMGHTSLLSTQRYLKVRPPNLDSAVSPLDRLPL